MIKAWPVWVHLCARPLTLSSRLFSFNSSNVLTYARSGETITTVEVNELSIPPESFLVLLIIPPTTVHPASIPRSPFCFLLLWKSAFSSIFHKHNHIVCSLFSCLLSLSITILSMPRDQSMEESYEHLLLDKGILCPPGFSGAPALAIPDPSP